MPIYDPTGFKLPGLVYDQKTRVGGEFYLYYNLGIANYLGTLGLDGNNVPRWQPNTTCGSGGTNPDGGFTVARVRKSLATSTDSTWIVNGLSGIIPGQSPISQSCELGAAQTEVTTYNIIGAQPGDSVDIIVLPDPANDVLVCYDQGFNAASGNENKPIPRKFEAVDHYVRQRPENNITLTEMYTCNLSGLSKLRQRDVTLIGKFFPDGGGVPCEIIYYTVVRLSNPMEVPQEANDSVTVSAEGSFQHDVRFTAEPD